MKVNNVLLCQILSFDIEMLVIEVNDLYEKNIGVLMFFDDRIVLRLWCILGIV